MRGYVEGDRQGARDSGVEEVSGSGGPAFQDDEAGRVTLSLDGPPLVLPEELAGEESRTRLSVLPEPQHLDAWNADRLRRSSLPPSAATAVFPSTVPPGPERSSLSGELDEGDVLSLVGRAPPAQSVDLVTEMSERFALGDFSGALRAAELLLGRDPGLELAQHFARESRAKLEDMYTSRLRDGLLRVIVSPSELAWLGLDPQVTALLSQLDTDEGLDYEHLLAHTAMPRLWALRALVELLDARVIRLV